MQVQRREGGVDLLLPHLEGGQMPVTYSRANSFYEYAVNRIVALFKQVLDKVYKQDQQIAFQGERISALEERDTLREDEVKTVREEQKLTEEKLQIVEEEVALLRGKDALRERQQREDAARAEEAERRAAEAEAKRQEAERELRESQAARQKERALNDLENQLAQEKRAQRITNAWVNPLATAGGGAVFGIPFGPVGMAIGAIGSLTLSLLGINGFFYRKRALINRQIQLIQKTR